MRHTVVFFIILLCIVYPAVTWRFRGKQRSPVIFVPGDGGSQVEAKLNKTASVHYVCGKTSPDFFNIWLNLELLVPVIIDCWIDNMRLVYDNVTRSTRNPDGVEIRMPGWGDPNVVEYLDPSKAYPGSYFKDIGNMLVSDLGYIRNLSLRGAPYDFRKAPNENEEYFVKLKELVEETYLINGAQPVTLMAHSMGGPMSMIFLQRQSQKWKNQYISSLVTLGAVWGGSVKALKVFAIGDDLGTYVLRESTLKNQQITCPSLGWLLPSKLFWKENEILVETQQKNYTLADLKDFLIDVGVPNGWEFRKDTEKFQQDYRAPGVEIHCLHGVKVDTVEREWISQYLATVSAREIAANFESEILQHGLSDYKKALSADFCHRPASADRAILLYYKPGVTIDGYPQLITGDGDGTVNVRSLEGCLHWQNQQKQKIYHETFPGVNHMEILRNSAVLDYVRTILTPGT